jgi:hypothetical protein
MEGVKISFATGCLSYIPVRLPVSRFTNVISCVGPGPQEPYLKHPVDRKLLFASPIQNITRPISRGLYSWKPRTYKPRALSAGIPAKHGGCGTYHGNHALTNHVLSRPESRPNTVVAARIMETTHLQTT